MARAGRRSAGAGDDGPDSPVTATSRVTDARVENVPVPAVLERLSCSVTVRIRVIERYF